MQTKKEEHNIYKVIKEKRKKKRTFSKTTLLSKIIIQI